MKCKAITKATGFRCHRKASIGTYCAYHHPSRVKAKEIERAKKKAVKEKARLAALHKYQDAIDTRFDRLRRMQLFARDAKKALKTKGKDPLLK